MINSLMIYNRMRGDPAFKKWSYEDMIMNLYYYLCVVDKQYYANLATLDAIVTDIKKAFGIIRD